MKHKADKKLDIYDIPDLPRALQKWEYKVVNIEAELENRLDALGAMGWELLKIEEKEYIKEGGVTQKYLWTVFKRPVF